MGRYIPVYARMPKCHFCKLPCAVLRAVNVLKCHACGKEFHCSSEEYQQAKRADAAWDRHEDPNRKPYPKDRKKAVKKIPHPTLFEVSQ